MEMLIDPRLNRSGEKIHMLTTEERAERLKLIYKNRMGSELDLNDPLTFTEKIQWYKLFYHHPDLSRCVDKVDSKEYIAEKIGEGHTAKLLRVWNSPDEVCFDGLPDRFVVKSNCQSEGKYIVMVKDKNTFDFESLTDEIKKYWFNPMNLLINGFCNAYHTVKPKVFVEEFLGEELHDYKFFCFSGKPELLYVSQEKLVDGKPVCSECQISFYDFDWKMIDVNVGGHPTNPNAPKPYHIEEMRKTAESLAADFPFIRVDFFDTEDQFYISELTFYPSGLTSYNPDTFNRHMGDMFKLK